MEADNTLIPGLGGEPEDDEVGRLLADPREILCHCEGIPAFIVLAAIRRGAATTGEISAQCSAGSGCSSCHGMIEVLIERHAAGRLPREEILGSFLASRPTALQTPPEPHAP